MALAYGEGDARVSAEELGRLVAFAEDVEVQAECIRTSAGEIAKKALATYRLTEEVENG